MKVAATSDDAKTISQHFGRAPLYIVPTLEDGKVVSTEVRDKIGHQQFAGEEHELEEEGLHGYGPQADSRHSRMMNDITDCEALLAGDMWWGSYESLRSRGIKPFITAVRDIHEAGLLHARGKLHNLQERLH